MKPLVTKAHASSLTNITLKIFSFMYETTFHLPIPPAVFNSSWNLRLSLLQFIVAKNHKH